MEIILLVIIVLLLLILLIHAMLVLQKNLASIEANLKQDFSLNRQEFSGIAKDNRDELNKTLKDFAIDQNSRFKIFQDSF